MGVYTHWTDGYLLETTYGTSLIAAAGTQTNSLGVLSEEAIHPSPKSDIVYADPGGSTKEAAAGAHWKGPEDLRGAYTVVLQNGILLYLAIGSSSTAASVHTITPTASSAMPSISIQHDLTGTASDWGTQIAGVKVLNLELNCTAADQYLWANVDWVAQSATNIGFISTNAPVLPPTATAAPYLFNTMTATFDTVSFKEGLTDLQISISPMLKVWKDGTRTIPEPLDGPKMQYMVKFKYTPPDSTFWDEAATTTVTGDLVFKWTKSTNDYIQITFSDCPITYYNQVSPKTGQALIEEVTLEPRAISVAVKDAIAGSYYGE